MSDTRAIRLEITSNVLAALERYVTTTKPLDEHGDLARYPDGRPVILDIAAAFHLIADADEAKRDRESRTHVEQLLSCDGEVSR